jgi:hypothetical protein
MEEEEEDELRPAPCWMDAPASRGGGLVDPAPAGRAVGAAIGLVDMLPVDSAAAGAGMGTEVGLRTRWTVDPSAISYSFNSLLSASAFPLSSNLCESTDGADGDEAATRDLSVEMGSVREAVMGNVRDGLRDLTMRLI